MKYTSLLRDIHSHLVEGAKIAKDINEERKAEEEKKLGAKAKKDKEGGIKYRRYEEKEAKEGDEKGWRKLRGMTQTQVRVSGIPKAETTVEVQKFLTKLELRETEEGEFGTTWLELYALYKALVHPCAVADPKRSAQARPSLGKQLQTFKLTVRRVAKQKLCQKDKELLKVCTHRGYALERLGISNHAAMVASVVKVSREAQRHLDRELLKANGSKRTEVEEQLKGEKDVTVGKLCLKKKVAWSKGARKLKPELAEAFREESLRAEVAFEEDENTFSKRARGVGARTYLKKKRLPDTDFVGARTRGQTKKRCMEAPQTGELSLIIRPGMLSTALRNRFGYLCTET